MKLLAIDTSTSSTVLGLQHNDIVIDRSVVDVKTHSRDILPAVSMILEESGSTLHELDAIVFGQGPGSFTGLRIAVGVVQGLAYGAGIPVVPVSSMAVLAQTQAGREDIRVFVALAARLKEIYYGGYSLTGGVAAPVIPEGVADVSDLDMLEEASWHCITDATTLVPEMQNSLGVSFESVSSSVTPAVDQLLSLGRDALARGETVTALEATPVYLREQVVFR